MVLKKTYIVQIIVIFLNYTLCSNQGFKQYHPQILFANKSNSSQDILQIIKETKNSNPITKNATNISKINPKKHKKPKSLYPRERAFSAIMRFSISSSPYGLYLSGITFLIEQIIPKLKYKKKRYSHLEI